MGMGNNYGGFNNNRGGMMGGPMRGGMGGMRGGRGGMNNMMNMGGGMPMGNMGMNPMMAGMGMGGALNDQLNSFCEWMEIDTLFQVFKAISSIQACLTTKGEDPTLAGATGITVQSDRDKSDCAGVVEMAILDLACMIDMACISCLSALYNGSEPYRWSKVLVLVSGYY